MTLPNPCCCDADCVIFEDIFDQPDDELAAHWDVISGTMTLDSATNIATITAGSVIGPTTNAPSGSAGFDICADWPTALTVVKVAYADANNHWRIEITGGHTVFALAAVLIEVYEVIGGADTFRGSRYADDTGSGCHELSACWGEDDRIYIEYNSTADPTWVWPLSVTTGGNSFRIEPTDDLEVTNAAWRKSEADVPGAVVPCCQYPNCMLCGDADWGDTMQIEALDGEDVGETFIVDRHLTDTVLTPYDQTLGYWRFDYAGDGASDYGATLYFCVTGNDDTEGRLTIVTDGSPGSGTVDFTPPDCTGPWEVVIDGVTYEITPL